MLLHKYATLVCTHAGEILPVASTLASNGPRHFVVSSQIIQRELTGILLPEFLTAVVLLQTCMPSVMDSSRTVPLVSGLLDLLDKFNRLAPGVQKEDEEDLAWPGGIGSPTPARRRADGDITFIRPEDLENHNKDGGLWVVIHGKVYDLQDFKDQVCTVQLFFEYADSLPLQLSSAACIILYIDFGVHCYSNSTSFCMYKYKDLIFTQVMYKVNVKTIFISQAPCGKELLQSYAG